MEHSLLHALQLLGIVVTLGGAFLMLVVVPRAPASGPAGVGANTGGGLRLSLPQSLARWTSRAALFGAFAALLNLFVDVAEVRNLTIFGGVSLVETWRFATITAVGQLTTARILSLLLVALALRCGGQLRWPIAGSFALAATLFNSLVCHAAALPEGRAAAVTLQFIHIAAAGLWLGALIQLLLARRLIENSPHETDATLIAGIANRFSPVALTAVVLIFVSGGIAAARYLLTPAAVPTSAYGLTLTVKLLLMTPLLHAGWMNYRVMRPALLACSPSPPEGGGRDKNALLQRFTHLLELEVTAGILVVAVAGILASVSPPSDGAPLRLTAKQFTALLTPDLPTTAIVDPQTFVGAAERTVDDLRYAEFTHNWSGVIVALLGVCWLAQSLRGCGSAAAGKIWPLLLIPFAAFIAYAADPEVWILKTMTLRQALADPAIAEHQIGAFLLLVLVRLGWRDRKKPVEARPLGYALPILMVAGSLLLLGHAHSALTAPQELTNLVNVQHAVFGALGLFAGTIRWLQLRGLVPDRAARLVWPSLVIALGIFMAFFYREVV